MELNNQVSLNTEMRCGIFSNAQGDIMIIHDKNLREIGLDWIEYDEREEKFSLVYADGLMQDFGIIIPKEILADISTGLEVNLLHLLNGKIQSSVQTTFIWRGI